MAYESLFERLAHREMVTPYLENAIMADTWPDQYEIKVDSRPYYGLGDGYFHPSTHTMMGERQLYYMFHPDHREKMVREPKRLASQMIFAMGSAMHAVVQTQFQMANVLEDKDIEVEYINKEHHVRGRLDFIVTAPGGLRIPVELKTINPFLFQKTKEIKPTWDAQLSLALDALGFNEGILLMVTRGDPFLIKEFRVPRNDELLSKIYKKFDYVRECIALNTPPKPCCALGSNEMKGCPARFECWLKED